MFRKIISICFYVLGGFFVYMVCLIGFIDIQQGGASKLAIVGGFSVPAIFFLVIGAAINRFLNWKSPIGITVLSAVGFSLFVVITVICLLLSPEFNEFFPDNSLAYFNDYFTGFSVMLALTWWGVFFLRTSKGEIAGPEASNSKNTMTQA